MILHCLYNKCTWLLRLKDYCFAFLSLNKTRQSYCNMRNRIHRLIHFMQSNNFDMNWQAICLFFHDHFYSAQKRYFMPWNLAQKISPLAVKKKLAQSTCSKREKIKSRPLITVKQTNSWSGHDNRQTSKWTDRHYQVHYLPASRSIFMCIFLSINFLF